MVTRTLRLDDDVNAFLEQLAESKRTSVDDVVNEMAQRYTERSRVVQKGLADVAAGRFVDGDQVDEWIGGWGDDEEQGPPKCPD